MIYLDVTSAASSDHHMGVHRTVRGIYHDLSARQPGNLTPLRWDFSRKRYATLSPRELQCLNHMLNGSDGFSLRRQWAQFRESWADDRARRHRGMPPGPFLRDGDCLFIPDLSWDRRIDFWPSLAKWPGRKVALFHDAMPLNLPGQSGSNDALFHRYVRALGNFDRVICVSREVADDLARYWSAFGVPARPVSVLPWPVPFTRPRPDNPPNQQAAHLVYVSRLKLRKNHLVLLDACERLWRQGRKFTLDFIGVADAFADTRKIVRRVRSLAARGRPVQWRRYISDEELTETYRACSFTVFPSKMEGFGLPIIESLWHRRPVICGRNGAIGEVASGGGCHQIDQNNPEELAQAIERLLTDRELYQRLYQEAGARAFTGWSDYGGDLITLLLSGQETT